MPAPLYLDYNATTPVAPEVLEAMLPMLTEHFGNPASEHAYGWAADEAVAQARERVAALVGGEPRGVVFTSGATEALNLALRGAAAAYGGRRHHLVTVATEHKAVLATCAALERDGYEVTTLGVDADGALDLDALDAALTDKTLLVAAMWANNETGVVHPVARIAEVAHRHGALLLTDATAAAGKVPLDVEAAGVDLLALSGHKLYAPKGVGALYVRPRGPRVRLAPEITGGSQEDGLRGGTVNVPGAVALGAAAALAGRVLAPEAARQAALRDRLEAALAARLDGVHVNAAGAERLPNTTSVRFTRLTAGRLLPALRGVAASTGAACQAKHAEPSHVLTAMGLTRDQALATVRFSLGRPTTEADIDAAADEVVAAVTAVRTRSVAA